MPESTDNASQEQPQAPPCTLRRSMLYLRALALMNKRDDEYVSSEELARFLCLGDATVRRDLSTFGKLGRRGVGYNVGALRNRLHRVSMSSRLRRGTLVGVGRLGSAFLGHGGLLHVPGLEVRYAFDVDTRKIGTEIGGVRILNALEMTDVVRREGIEVAIIAVPAEAAQEVVNALIAGGVRAILNFAPVQLDTPPDVLVSNIDMTLELQSLLLALSQMDAGLTGPGRRSLGMQTSRSSVA